MVRTPFGLRIEGIYFLNFANRRSAYLNSLILFPFVGLLFLLASLDKNLYSENATLRAELAALRGQLMSAKQANIGASLTETRQASYLSSKKESGNSEGGEPDLKAHLSIVVLGASGDLAVKKTYPALFALFRHKLMPKSFSIVGYARSEIKSEEFKKKISAKFPEQGNDMKEEFLSHCWYHSGQYDDEKSFQSLNDELTKIERKDTSVTAHNRIFYMAIPPTAFVPAAKSIKAAAFTEKGWNRIIVEKPFGRDLESSEQLGKELNALFSEDQIYRIDHYLGKEMVQNLQGHYKNGAIANSFNDWDNISVHSLTSGLHDASLHFSFSLAFCQQGVRAPLESRSYVS